MKSENKFKKWEEVRSIGFLKFVIKGTANFGGGMAIILILFELALRFFNSELKRDNFFEINNFAYFLFIWLLGGIAWSLIMWIWMEFTYRNYIKKYK